MIRLFYSDGGAVSRSQKAALVAAVVVEQAALTFVEIRTRQRNARPVRVHDLLHVTIRNGTSRADSFVD